MSNPPEPEGSRSDAAVLADRRFRELFGSQPALFRAPGRVNLIGEHTDYNDGWVMPAAIGMYTCAAAGPADGSRLTIHSINFDESRDFDLNALPVAPTEGAVRSQPLHWSDYVIGVAALLRRAGCALRGARIVLSGDIPIGAGLSSSASCEVATALALLSISGIHLDRAAIAQLCQRAENEYTGARCGIMDQFAACFGEAGCALLLDCRTLHHSLLPIPEVVRIVVCDTKVRHALASGEYNRRRAECEAGVVILKRFLPGISALRDLSMDQLLHFGSALGETGLKRCRHVISENARVRNAAEALQRGDLARFGALMYESHASQRNDYQVSCNELDRMVEIARGLDGVFGARMTGGGFGGCTVNLVESRAVEVFSVSVAQKYRAATSIVPEIHVCSPVSGAAQISVSARR